MAGMLQTFLRLPAARAALVTKHIVTRVNTNPHYSLFSRIALRANRIIFFNTL